MPAARNADVLAACGWAVATLCVVVLTHSTSLRILMSVPLLLFLSGHGVLRAIGPIASSLPEHLAYAVGVSIAACVLGGFVLDYLSWLTPLGWAVWLVAVTGGSALVVLYRNRPPESFLFALRLPDLRRRHVALMGFAILIAGGAYLLAVHAALSDKQFKYVEFWMIPGGAAAPGELIVGIKNAEPKRRRFDVEVKLGRRIIALWRSIAVAPGKTWTRGLGVTLAPGHPEKVRAWLYGHEDGIIYRKVSAIVPAA